jgi:hypothetical protein
MLSTRIAAPLLARTGVFFADARTHFPSLPSFVLRI